MKPRRRRTAASPAEGDAAGAAPESPSGADMPLFKAPESGGEAASAPAERAPVEHASASPDSAGAPDGGGEGGSGGVSSEGGSSEGGSSSSGDRQGRDGRGRRRRRRQRGDRPQGAPQQDRAAQPQQPNRGYSNNNSGGGDRNNARRGRRRRGANEGGGSGGGRSNNNSGGGRPVRRGGLDILKDMQQIGAALDPTERLILELPAGAGDPPSGDRITGRAIDLIAPIGRGQRCLIVSPPKAGKTRILQAIAASIAHNHPDVAIYALLVDERPEEVTDFKRNTPAEVIAASSDMSIAEHIETAERAMEVVAQQVIAGKDVVLLLDSITRLARAYNAASGNGGRTMSGGLDSNAMQAPRQIFGSARKIENGGSLTIFGTALVDTGSRMDQVIFEEFKGTGNSEIYLSRELAERRIYPAIDIPKSGTRKEEKLIAPELIGTFQALRRILVQMPPQEAMLKLTDRLNKTKTNEDFFNLVRVGES